MAAYAALVSLAQTTDLKSDQEKYLFPSDAKENIKSIHEYVIFLKSFLEDSPEKANRWERKIRDVAYKTQDIIDFFTWQLSRQDGMNPSSIKLENVTEEIGLIAGEVMDERAADLSAAISSSSRLAPTGNDVVIGLQDDLLAIKERLCQLESPNLQVIPIVGMGGIGKTTLARTLYDDQCITEHFDIRAWLIISQDYSAARIRILSGLLDSILEQLGEKDRKDESNDDVETKVYKRLFRRRFLIVMDDVWSTEVWDDLRMIFPDNGNGSRIMVTTRLSELAASLDSDSRLHEMQFMNDSQSWDLLKQKVFANNLNYPLELEDVGKEIARNCAGLPLAVVLVAGVLSAISGTRASWEKIARTINSVVGGKLEEILSLSYTHLPHHLRPCFILIGGFPEDADIHASRLTKLWVAEGFLKHQSGCSKSLEEEGEEYLEDLYKRNLVVVSSWKSDGKIKCCSLHDMVRDLCIRKAREEKFLHVMEPARQDNILNKRRISFRRSDIDNILDPTIRTILCFQPQDFSSWVTFLRCSKLLRVLDALDDNPKELPLQVFELFHLRYLALVSSLTIPSLISHLPNLQTLIIRPTFLQTKRHWRNDKYASHFSLPLEIWRLQQLRHIILYDLYMLPHPPAEEEGSDIGLQNLQTLWLVENLVWNEKILQMIPNVKRLGLVYTNINQEYHLHLLKYLDQLEKLEVNGCLDFSWRGQNPTFPMTLRKLSLVGGRFPWKDMSIIASLPNLQVLKLLHHACDGSTWETADEEFPELKYLLIHASDPRQWITQSSHFPRLECLVLRFCWYLMEIPQDIGDIPTLELIQIERCNKSLVRSAKQIKEDQQSNGNDALQVRFDYSSLIYDSSIQETQ